MSRIVRTSGTVRPNDDLTDGYLEKVSGLKDLDLTNADNLSIIECDVKGLLLPEGAEVYVRRCTGEMRVRSAPSPTGVPQEIGSLFLQRARLNPDIAKVAVDVGTAVMDLEGRLCWEHAWPLYSKKYSPQEMDEAGKFVFANHPNLLKHWARAKKLRDPGLIEDYIFMLGKGDTAPFQELPYTGRPDDRYEAARFLERYLPNHWNVEGTIRIHVSSIEPFLMEVEAV